MTDPPTVTPALPPCPFCGGGKTMIDLTHNPGVRMDRSGRAVISATVLHWCEREDGQPQSVMRIVGRTEADAVRLWSARART